MSKVPLYTVNPSSDMVEFHSMELSTTRYMLFLLSFTVSLLTIDNVIRTSILKMSQTTYVLYLNANNLTYS